MDIAGVLSSVGSVASAVATIALVFLTGRYVKLTHAMVEEARLAKYPNVFVDLEFDDFEVKFLIGNAGSGPAKDLRFQVDDRVPWRKLQNYPSGLSELSIVKSGLSYLAPGRTLKFNAGYVENDPGFFAEGSGISIRLTFETEGGVQLEREFTIDLQSYSGVLFESFRDPQREVARAIRDAERDRSSHERISSQSNRFFKKNCPTCGELVSRSARKCPHCHEPIPEKKEEPDA